MVIKCFGDALEDERLAMGSKTGFVERDYRREMYVTYSAFKMLDGGSLRSASTSRWTYSRPDLPRMVDANLMPIRGVRNRR